MSAATVPFARRDASDPFRHDGPCPTTLADWRDDPQGEQATRLREIRDRHKRASRMEFSAKKAFDEGGFKPSGGYIVNFYPSDVGFLLEERDRLAARVAELEAAQAAGAGHSAPSREWLLRMADAEDRHQSIAVGGLAVETGQYVDPAKLQPLTERQAEVLREIIKFRDTNGASPTFRELMPLIGVSSPNGAKIHIDALIKKGWLTLLSAGGSRAIVPRVSAAQVPVPAGG